MMASSFRGDAEESLAFPGMPSAARASQAQQVIPFSRAWECRARNLSPIRTAGFRPRSGLSRVQSYARKECLRSAQERVVCR
jgi:hypothetical protein